MIKIDLVTGFLGSGKTTFLKKYAEYLADQGCRVGIIENDFGAVNIDMLMLQDLLGDKIDVEQIVGGNVVTDWKRRFKTKLISMAMRGFNRILVEPSGIYDVDAFFDVLGEEPIDSWYEVGNLFTILNAVPDRLLSREERYLMVSQSANAGRIIMSKVQESTFEDRQSAAAQLNEIMEEFRCPRRFSLPQFTAAGSETAPAAQDNPGSGTALSDILFDKPWDALANEDFKALSESGWVRSDHEKLWFDPKKAFSSLFFMHVQMTEEKLREVLADLFAAEDCGNVFRVKGYLPLQSGNWLELNATPKQMRFQTVPVGQEILIVIGQDLHETNIRAVLQLSP